VIIIPVQKQGETTNRGCNQQNQQRNRKRHGVTATIGHLGENHRAPCNNGGTMSVQNLQQGGRHTVRKKIVSFALEGKERREKP